MRILILLFVLLSYAFSQKTITVTSKSDDGKGSLRNAIAKADSGTIIRFSSDLYGKTIHLKSPLVILIPNLIVDGDIDADGNADILLDGGNKSFDGIVINADQVMISKMKLSSFFNAIINLPEGENRDGVIKKCIIFENNVGINLRGTITQNSMFNNNVGITSYNYYTVRLYFFDGQKVFGSGDNGVLEFFAGTNNQGRSYLGTLTLNELAGGGKFTFDLKTSKWKNSEIYVLARVNWGNHTETNGFIGTYTSFGTNRLYFTSAEGSYITFFSSTVYLTSLFSSRSSNENSGDKYRILGLFDKLDPGRILNENLPLNSLLPDKTYNNPIFYLDGSRDWSYANWPQDAPRTNDNLPLQVTSLDTWAVYNDLRANALGIQITKQIYTIINQPSLEDFVLIREKFTNKTNTVYDSCYVTLFGEINAYSGYPNSWYTNLIGTDTTLNLLYFYEPVRPSPVFYVSTGVKFLKFTVGDVQMNPSSMIWYKKYLDDNRMVSYQINLIKGLNGNGSPRHLGIPSLKFDFPGDPLTGSGIVDTLPDDKKFMLSVGPFRIKPGETAEVVYVIMSALPNDRLYTVSQLKQQALQISDYYKTNFSSALTKEHYKSSYSFDLKQNYPNPFNPSTTIRFSLQKPGPVEIEIYNILGQRVRKLIQENRFAGLNLVRWDGHDDRGNPLASGVYIYRLKSAEGTLTKKMLLLK